MKPLTRRQVLAAAAAGGIAVAAGCGESDDSGNDAGTATTLAPNSAQFSLVPVFPPSGKYLAATFPQRMPFVLAGSDGAPLDTIEGDLTFTLVQEGKAIGDPVVVKPHGVGLLRSYLPVPMLAGAAGIVDVRTTYQGEEIEASVQVWEPSEVGYPQIGNPIPSVVTPTLTDPAGVDPICTAEPPCDFHRQSFAASLAAKRPVALLVSTPAYCQTAICGPVLDLLVKESAGRPNIDIIHAEVYANPTKVDSVAAADSAPVVTAFSMEFEPALFLVDASGVLVQRLDTIFDRDELTAALDLLGR